MFYLDLAELPDDTRPKLHRLSREILAILRNLFPGGLADDDLPVEVHINNGYLPTDKNIPQDEKRGYVYHTPERGSLHHIVVTRDAVEPGGEYTFALQLSHELGHILFYREMQYNNALIETFCIALSFSVAEALAKRAKAGRDSEFAPSGFLHRRADYVRQGLKHLPAEIRSAVRSGLWYQLSLYLRYKRRETDSHMYGIHEDYRFSILGAVLLTSGQVPWSEMAGIGAVGSLIPDDQNSDTFWVIDIHRLTPGVQSALRRLGRAPEKPMLIARFDVQPWLFGGFRFWEDGQYVWLREVPGDRREKWERKIAALRPSRLEWDEG